MDIESVASVSVISPAPAASRRLYIDALDLPLEAAQTDDEYFHSESRRAASISACGRLAELPRLASAGRSGLLADRCRKRVSSLS